MIFLQDSIKGVPGNMIFLQDSIKCVPETINKIKRIKAIKNVGSIRGSQKNEAYASHHPVILPYLLACRKMFLFFTGSFRSFPRILGWQFQTI